MWKYPHFCSARIVWHIILVKVLYKTALHGRVLCDVDAILCCMVEMYFLKGRNWFHFSSGRRKFQFHGKREIIKRQNKNTSHKKMDFMKRINRSCVPDKNMLGQDQLRYIGCQTMTMTQIYSDSNTLKYTQIQIYSNIFRFRFSQTYSDFKLDVC